MGKPAVDIDQLTSEEKLDLLDRLRDSLGRDPDALPLSDEQKRDLDQRIDDLRKDGPTGVSWDEAVEQTRRARDE
jgi:putative addiction module component (TIGR02574 family)